MITHKPTGIYATIEVENSNKAFEILINENESSENKIEIILSIEKNPGDYNPIALLGAGNYFLSQQNFDKAAFYFRAGIFRANIDIKASNDSSLENIISELFSFITEQAEKFVPPAEFNLYKNALILASQKLVAWDKSTPRHYDIRWASLHSLNNFTNKPLNYLNKKKYKQLIEKEYDIFEKQRIVDMNKK